RELDRAPRADDPRLGGRLAARGPRQPDPAVGRHRVRSRPRGRSRTGIGASMSDLDVPDGWTIHDGRLVSAWKAPSYVAGFDLLAATGRAADDANHHPALEYVYPGVVRVVLVTHEAGSTVTERDTSLGATI